MSMDRSYSEEGGWIHWKTIIGLDSAGTQERETEGNLERGPFWMKQQNVAKHGAQINDTITASDKRRVNVLVQYNTT